MNMNRLKKAARVVGAIVAATAVAFGVGLPPAGGPWMQQAGGPQNPGPAQPTRPSTDDYKRIAKWAVSYADKNLGLVEGKATCRWQALEYREGVVFRTRPVRCELKVRNPRTGKLHVLSVPDFLLLKPDKQNPALRMTLLGQLPGDPVERPSTPALSLKGAPGGTATITIKNGKTESEGRVEISAAARADFDEVKLTLYPDPNGVFSGEWQYNADPLTERNANGVGADGIFDTLRDEDVGAYSPQGGGFLGLQKGTMTWRPLPPTIYAVHVLEDQAEFTGVGLAYRYPYHHGQPLKNPNLEADPEERDHRTLVIIGRDLPMFDHDPVFDFEGKNGDALNWKILANVRDKDLSPEHRVLFERAWREVTQGWDTKEAQEFRKLDAVLVRVPVGGPAGPVPFTWGTAQAEWTKQYGDNTAELRFVRLVETGTTSGTAGAARPRDKYEPVTALAIPEKIYVEVHTGTRLWTEVIPVIVGTADGQANIKVPLRAVATGEDEGEVGRVYRTPPIVVKYRGAEGTKGVPADGATVVEIPSNHLLATVNLDDRDASHFLRIRPAEAVGGSAAWEARLWEVLRCGGPFSPYRGLSRDAVDEQSWPGLARRSEATVSGVPVRYGDHAAMLLLRDAFVQALSAQMPVLEQALAADTPPDLSDGIVDAWYRSVAPAVTEIPDFPLATVMVRSPTKGAVPFKEAYSKEFREAAFHPATTPNGQIQFVEWRREVSRQAMKYELQQMTDAFNRAKAIAADEYGRCNYKELLKFTGSGFQHVAERVSPLLMKRGPDGLYEPDRLARAYTQSLDVLAAEVGARKELASAWRAVIVAAAGIIAPPLFGAAWGVFGAGSVAVNATAAEIVSAWTGYVGGWAPVIYENAHDLYESYQSHEEVRFAYGAYAVLGLDHYFDAASRSQSWWQDVVGVAKSIGWALVFPKAVQSGATAVYRGGAIALSLAGKGLSAVRGLPAQSKGLLILYLGKQRQLLHEVKAVGGEGARADRIFVALEKESAGQPVPAEDPIFEVLEQQAAKFIPEFGEVSAAIPAEQFGPGPDVGRAVEKLRAIKNQRAADALLTEHASVKAEAHAGPKQADPQAGLHPPLIDVSILEPLPLRGTPDAPRGPPGMPPPGLKVDATIALNGADQHVTLDLGVGRSFKSLFFGVYDLNSLEGIPPDVLDAVHAAGLDTSKRMVVKILNKQNPNLVDIAHFFPGIDEHVAERMLRAQARLKDAGIPQVRIVGFGAARVKIAGGVGGRDLLFQERFTEGPDFVLLHDEFDLLKDPTKAKSLAELIKKFIDNRLGFLDAHIGNVVFKKGVCEVLDQDFIGTIEELKSGVYGDRLREREDKLHDLAPSAPEITDAKGVMYAEMVWQEYIRYDRATRKLLSGWMDIKMIESVFPDIQDWFAGVTKRSQRRSFDVKAMRDLIDVAGVRAREVFLGRPAWAAA